MLRKSKIIRIDGEAIKNEFTYDMVKALTLLGYRAMMHAYGQHSFTHRTRNLHDSYASAVYVNGVLITESIRYVGGVLSRKVDKKTKKTGRQTVHDYLESNHFGGKNEEIVLVVIAAMYYTKYLEGGDKNTNPLGAGERFIVISPARKYINDNYSSALAKVYAKYGITEKPKAKVIKGERIPD